ncbi:hypothetical protein DFH06DRAFT_1212693 [Mycena polygramma]|nr:hypothetical protein DFH06DRAFT_1212693 [Mycena polygramma]
MSLVEAYRDYNLHIAGGIFNRVAGDHKEYHVTGNFVQPQGEGGISILQRGICGDAFYNSEQRFPPPQCHPNTRTAVQNTIQAWSAACTPRVMWLYGPAGGGKSAIAQTMAERWADAECLGAAFFFARWREGGSSGKTLFPTIAYQLALHIPQLRTSIGRAVEEDPAICDKALEEQARVLIVNPVSGLLDHDHGPSPYLVIIDGLDECAGTAVQSRIIQAVFRICTDNSLPLRFLICSRPEPHIRETFESMEHRAEVRRVVLDDSFQPSLDIRRYLRDRFADMQQRRFPNEFGTYPPWPSDEDLATVVNAASGQFIYAATVTKFVDDEYSHPADQLRLVLRVSGTQAVSAFGDLDNLYSLILSTNPNVSLVVRILGAFFAIPDPENILRHSAAFLDSILGLQRGTVRLALRGLHSILFIPDSDDSRIRVHHASLHDFLSSPERSGRFYLARETHHTELAEQCLSIILRSVEEPHPSNALLTYAHTAWTNHYLPTAKQHLDIRTCLRAFRAAFDPPHLNSLTRDPNALLGLFVRLIQFLKTLAKTPFAHFMQEYDSNWDTLLTTLFNPGMDVAQFLEAWTPVIVPRVGLTYLSGGVYATRISSSLGVIFETLWNADVHDLEVHIRGKTSDFLRRNSTPQICYGAANITLRLLVFRSAEIRADVSSTSARIQNIHTRLSSPRDTIYNNSLMRSREPNWRFATQWCLHLVRSPAAPELLDMLQELVESGVFLRREEIHHDLLDQWLKEFDTDVAMRIARVFQHVRDHDSEHQWIYADFWQVDDISLIPGTHPPLCICYLISELSRN